LKPFHRPPLGFDANCTISAVFEPRKAGELTEAMTLNDNAGSGKKGWRRP
jgi:hypothetical protein